MYCSPQIVAELQLTATQDIFGATIAGAFGRWHIGTLVRDKQGTR